jgi:hypothetical protein
MRNQLRQTFTDQQVRNENLGTAGREATRGGVTSMVTKEQSKAIFESMEKKFKISGTSFGDQAPILDEQTLGPLQERLDELRARMKQNLNDAGPGKQASLPVLEMAQLMRDWNSAIKTSADVHKEAARKEQAALKDTELGRIGATTVRGLATGQERRRNKDAKGKTRTLDKDLLEITGTRATGSQARSDRLAGDIGTGLKGLNAEDFNKSIADMNDAILNTFIPAVKKANDALLDIKKQRNPQLIQDKQDEIDRKLATPPRRRDGFRPVRATPVSSSVIKNLIPILLPALAPLIPLAPLLSSGGRGGRGDRGGNNSEDAFTAVGETLTKVKEGLDTFMSFFNGGEASRPIGPLTSKQNVEHKHEIEPILVSLNLIGAQAFSEENIGVPIKNYVEKRIGEEIRKVADNLGQPRDPSTGKPIGQKS